MDNNVPNKKSSLGASLSCFFSNLWAKILSKKHVYPAFLLPFGLLLIIYAMMGIFPFGDRSVLVLDMNAQYIYYYEELRDILRGESSLIYTFERAIGGEFLGFFTYYVASPFAIIVALFPEGMIVESVMIMMLIKCGLSGLTFFIYLSKTRKTNLPAFYMFSVMYALCAYATTYQTNTMWMDALLWLPLVTLGVERLVTDGRFKLFIITLALTIWSNYYIGYMVCIFVFFYFFCFILAHSSKDTNNLRENFHYIRSFIRIAISSVIAILMVAVIIFSAYYSLSFGKSDTSNVEYTFVFRYDFFDFIAKMFIGSYDTIRPAGLPNIYCGTLALVLLPIYMLSSKIKLREKLAYGSLAALLVFSMMINALDLAWHGFQMPVWLNYRYSFIFSFIILVLAYKGFEALEEMSSKSIIVSSALVLILLFAIQKTTTILTHTSGKPTPSMPIFTLVLPTVVFIVIYSLLMFLALKNKKLLIKQLATFALLCTVCTEAVIGGYFTWLAEVKDVGWAKRNAYYDYVNQFDETVDYIYSMDDGFYRFEKTTMRKPNDNFALNIRGLSDSTSTMNKKLMKFAQFSGFSSKSHWIKYYSGNEVSDSIFGIKYVISDDKHPVSHTYTEIEGKEGKLIFKNENALSIAYCVSSKMKNFPIDEFESNMSSFIFLESLMSYMTDEEAVSLFNGCYSYVFEVDNCRKFQRYTGRTFMRFDRLDDELDATVTYRVNPDKDGSVYMFLPAYNTGTKISYQIHVDGVEQLKGSFYGSDDYRIHNIGNFEGGKEFVVTLTFDMDDLRIYTDYPLFVQINEETVNEYLSELKKGELKISDYSDTHFNGTISAESDEIVFTTVPYDKYWEVYVDGQRVDTYACADTFLAFDISEGEHTVEMKYRSKPFIYGLMISGGALLLFVIMCIFEKKYRKYKENEKIRISYDDEAGEPVVPVTASALPKNPKFKIVVRIMLPPNEDEGKDN